MQTTRQPQEKTETKWRSVSPSLFLTFPSNLAVAPSCTRIFRGGRVNAGASAGTEGLSVREVLDTRVDVTSFTSPMMWTVEEKNKELMRMNYLQLQLRNRTEENCYIYIYMYIIYIYTAKSLQPKVTSVTFWVGN